MSHSKHIEHELLLKWMIFIGVVLFAVLAAWREGLFTLLITDDQSRLSLVILLAFTAANIHVAHRVITLSRELNLTARVRALFDETDNISLSADRHILRFGGEALEDAFITRHLRNLVGRLANTGAVQDQGAMQTHLLDALDKRIRGGHKFGWLFADLMLKLGLMGTVIGFILMLGSVTALESYDAKTMQELMRTMSGGMRVALYTTLTGLISGLVLGAQYLFIDRYADDLLAEIEEISEVYAVPVLCNSSSRADDSTERGGV